MNLFAISGLINAISVFILGCIVYFKNRKREINIRYALFCYFVGFWSFCYFFWQISQDKNSALFWSRGLMAGAIFIPVCFLHFVLLLLDLYEKRKRIVKIGYLIFLFFFILNFTSWFVSDVKPKMYFRFWPEPGAVFSIFLLVWFWYCLYPCYLLIRDYRKFTGIKRQQAKYVLIAILIGYSSGSTNYFLWYNISIPPYGNFIVPLFVGMMAYAIVRYRLMDITITITRTGVFVAVYTLVLGLPFLLAIWGGSWLIGLLGPNWWVAPLVLMAALATVGPFLYIFLQSRAEAILLREQRRYQETLKQAAIGMTRIRDLDKLLNLIVHIVTKTVRISHSAIYLLEQKTEQYLLEAGRNLKKEQPASINHNSSLIVWLKNQKNPLIHEEIKRKAQDDLSPVFKEIERQMRQLNASVIIPSFLEDRLLGFIILGDKRSGAIYTQEDLDVFSVLATQAALAIENALFILEAKVMQEQISQAEKMATIGTMADGLSHQINNRLHALSMIAGDTLDTLKLTNTENCPEEYKKVFADIKYALERIQANVMQGREVVSGLLKYSRKGEEGFMPVAIDEIINGALEMVKFKVKLSEIDLVRDYPQDLPRIKANLTQLQEVFFNLIDNAYDAIIERKQTLKESAYHGRITISCPDPTDNSLKIIFADNGIGLKEEDRRKVFTPFFTTKVSSRRGTGLGLFVIHRIITELHQGEVRFESEYGKGTRFIINLPVAK